MPIFGIISSTCRRFWKIANPNNLEYPRSTTKILAICKMTNVIIQISSICNILSAFCLGQFYSLVNDLLWAVPGSVSSVFPFWLLRVFPKVTSNFSHILKTFLTKMQLSKPSLRKGHLFSWFVFSKIISKALCLPPNICINYCFRILLGGLHIPKTWKK